MQSGICAQRDIVMTTMSDVHFLRYVPVAKRLNWSQIHGSYIILVVSELNGGPKFGRCHPQRGIGYWSEILKKNKKA